MKTRRGWVQGYNGQAMVDCETQVIVAQALVQDANDVQQLELADAGYWSDANAGARGKAPDGTVPCHDQGLEAAQGHEGSPTAAGPHRQGCHATGADGKEAADQARSRGL